MAGVDSSVRAGLRVKLETMASLPPVAWDGYEYNPIIGTTYFRERVVTQDRRPTSLGAFCRIAIEGVWMVDIYTPARKGLALSDDWSHKLMTLFPPGLTLSRDGLLIRISRSHADGAVIDGDWVLRPCMIDWNTETTNTI